jgi:plasmid maintenance system antidote protein VapI
LVSNGPSFQGLQSRLLVFVRTKINNGEFSERGLARSLGVSQPQLHNVLKGARRLQPDLADLILKFLALSVPDLLSVDEISNQQKRLGIEASSRTLSGFAPAEHPARRGNMSRKGPGRVEYSPSERKAC